jgi:hypothetical protein
MNASTLRIVILAACAVLLAGCHTPQPVLDQASNAAALTGSLDSELRAFKEVRTAVANGRIASIKRQENEIARIAGEDAYGDRTLVLAGRKDYFELMDILRKLADSRRADDEDFAKRLAATEKALAETTAPLSVPSEKLAATQKLLSVLGQELTREEWLKFLVGFAKEVRRDMKDAKQSAAGSIAKGGKEIPAQGAPTKKDEKAKN